MAALTGLTIDDFERLPADAVKHRELVDGKLIDVSGNTPRHNLLRDYLVTLLRNWITQGHPGMAIAEQEYDFLGNAHGPDVTYLLPEKQSQLDLGKRIQRFVPDLAVEVASENDTHSNLLRKKNRYRRAGTAEVWLIDPDSREISIYSDRRNTILTSSGDTLTSPLLPGFSIALDDLFRGL
jgi:Uma2 family endonuclease